MTAAHHLLVDASNLAIWLAAITVLIFFIRYTTIAPWWRNAVGITIVALDFCLEMVFIPACILLTDPHFPFLHSIWWQWLEILAIYCISVVAVWRTISWHLIHRRGKLPDELE